MQFIENHPVPTASDRLGAKGAGEAGNVGALAAIMNAIVDALSKPASRMSTCLRLRAASGSPSAMREDPRAELR